MGKKDGIINIAIEKEKAMQTLLKEDSQAVRETRHKTWRAGRWRVKRKR
jgi:hypothetical protein